MLKGHNCYLSFTLHLAIARMEKAMDLGIRHFREPWARLKAEQDGSLLQLGMLRALVALILIFVGSAAHSRTLF